MSGGRNICVGNCTNSAYVCTLHWRSVQASMQCRLTLSQTTCTYKNCHQPRTVSLNVQQLQWNKSINIQHAREMNHNYLFTSNSLTRKQQMLSQVIFQSLQLISIFLIICLRELNTNQKNKSAIQWMWLCPQRFLLVQAFHWDCRNPQPLTKFAEENLSILTYVLPRTDRNKSLGQAFFHPTKAYFFFFPSFAWARALLPCVLPL